MTLLTQHLEAGWHEVERGEFGKWVAERVHARPGATSTVINVEAPSSRLLNEAVTLRQSQLAGTEEPIKDTITDDGTLVTGDQHEALKTDGLVVPGPEETSTADEAKDAEIEALRAKLAESEAALAATQTGPTPETDADPSEAPATEQAADSSSSSEPTSESPAPSPEEPSTEPSATA